MEIRRIIVAMRGRNPDNPNDRRGSIYLEQRLELNKDDISNCLTSVTKDNMVLEIYGNSKNQTSN